MNLKKNIINKKPYFSVVIVTKGDRLKLLEKCLKSLSNQKFQNFETVLVYSIYSDKLFELCKTYEITPIKEVKPILGAVRNQGVKEAKSDNIAFIDDDCEAPETWLQKIHDFLRDNPSISCVGGSHVSPPEEVQSDGYLFAVDSFYESHWQRSYYDRSAVGKIAGCNVLYKRKALRDVGYFNTLLTRGEDWDLNIRLVENGYKIIFIPDLFVWHHRHGMMHAFWDHVGMAPFYTSWNVLKYAKHESLFASFYIANTIFWSLMIFLFISPQTFFFLSLFILVAYILSISIRTRIFNWKIIYYTLIIPMTLLEIIGFYYGLSKHMVSKIRSIND